MELLKQKWFAVTLLAIAVVALFLAYRRMVASPYESISAERATQARERVRRAERSLPPPGR
jgi:hypothetical protein